MSLFTPVAVEERLPAITNLMDQLDQLAFTAEPGLGREVDWEPTTSEGHAVLEQLLAVENRAALHAWYDYHSGKGLNPSAAVLKTCLERRLGTLLGRRSESGGGSEV